MIINETKRRTVKCGIDNTAPTLLKFHRSMNEKKRWKKYVKTFEQQKNDKKNKYNML